MALSLSVIVPTLNEAAGIGDCLHALQVARGPDSELLLVDGGSQDATLDIAAPLVDRVLPAARGRATQMNAGAAAASGDMLWFVHADSIVSAAACAYLRSLCGQDVWGRFDVDFAAGMGVRMVANCMNLRSRLSGIATGDQALFISRRLFTAVNGFPPIALMEDVAISSALKRQVKPLCPSAKVQPSARRWQQQGLLHTVLLMWRLRLAYFCGADPQVLHDRYYRRFRL